MDEAPRFCGVSASLNVGGQQFCKWPETTLRYCIRDTHPLVAKETWRSMVENAIDLWHASFDLDFTRVDNADAAHLLFTIANLGGRGGVLADAQLVPCGIGKNDDFQSLIRFDKSDVFVSDLTGDPMAILIREAGGHEIGHALGAPHISTPNSLMNPVYDPRNRGLRAGDFELFEGLGYRRRAAPLPPNQAPPPSSDAPLGAVGTRALRPGVAYTPRKRAWVLEEL